MVVAKRQERGKDHKNRTKEGPRTRVRTSGKTNCTPGWPSLHRAGSGGGETTYKKRSQSQAEGPLFSSRLLGRHALRMYFPLFSK